MDYNWEEIFKSKTTKELYEIYRGSTYLPEETISIAKQELERRDFDFNNLEYYHALWKIESISDEIDYFNFDLSFRRFYPPYYILIFIAVISIITTYFTWNDTKGRINPYLMTVILLFYVVAFLSSNYFYNKRLLQINNLIEEKKLLLDKISNHELRQKKASMIGDLSTKHVRRIKDYKLVSMLLIVFILIAILLRIFS